MKAEIQFYGKATCREWVGLAVLALPCLLYSMDLTVLLLAVPHLTADLRPSATQLLWITDIYGFLLAGFLITMGTLGDRIGRRKLLMIGASAFGLASVIAAFSTSAEMLILARGLLGIAGATLAPSTLSLIRNMFHDDKQRTFAIGVWIASFSAGGAFGPLIGGVLLEHFWWGSVFLLAVPIMIALLILGPYLLPESKDPNPGRIDLFSVILSLLGVLGIIYGIKKTAEEGLEWAFAAFMLAGFLLVAAFLQRQKTLEYPLIDMTLLKVREFRAALCVNIIGLCMAFGFFMLIAQYLQLVAGMGPLEAGLWMAPSGIAFVLGSMLVPVYLRYFQRVHIIAAGFILTAAGFLLLSHTSESMVMFVCGYLIFCFGIAPIGTLTTDLVMSLAPPERAGAASAISETSFELGGAMGIALLGSVVMFMYRRILRESHQEVLPAEALDSIGGAVAVSSGLPTKEGAALLYEAQAAFTTSMEFMAVISACAALVASALTLKFLRHYKGA